LLGIGAIAALVIGWQVAAFAVHDTGAFELDGNANNQAAAGDDWDNVCHQVTITNDQQATPPTPSPTSVLARATRAARLRSIGWRSRI